MRDENAPVRRNPIPPKMFDPAEWYQVKEFTTTREHIGYLRLSRTAWLDGVKNGDLPPGRKIGHYRYWFGGQIEAFRKGRNWREVKEPEQVIL